MTAEKLVIFVFFYSIFYSLVFMLTANTVKKAQLLISGSKFSRSGTYYDGIMARLYYDNGLQEL